MDEKELEKDEMQQPEPDELDESELGSVSGGMGTTSVTTTGCAPKIKV